MKSSISVFLSSQCSQLIFALCSCVLLGSLAEAGNLSVGVSKPVDSVSMTNATVSEGGEQRARDRVLILKSPEEQGAFIVSEADHRASGFGSASSTVQMKLYDKKGRTRNKMMRFSSFEESDKDKSLIVFDTPKAQRGISLLTFSFEQGDDQQWLYLPAFKRTKRISSSNKSSPFVGSEFAFEDISNYALSQFTYRYLGEETAIGRSCFVVEIIPSYKGSGYAKKVSWIDTSNFQYVKTEFFDKKGNHVKTLVDSDYQRYSNGQWRSHLREMVNHKKGTKTELIFSEYEFCAECESGNLSKNTLGKI